MKGTKSIQEDETHLSFSVTTESFGDLVHPKVAAKLREIEHDLEDTDNEKTIQLIIDENLLNMLIRTKLRTARSESLREALKRGPPNAQQATKFMNTSIIGKALPAITEEFGEDRPVDLVLAFNASFLESKLDSFTETGISIKKSGNIALKFNTSIQVLVQDESGQWKSARDVFLQL